MRLSNDFIKSIIYLLLITIFTLKSTHSLAQSSVALLPDFVAPDCIDRLDITLNTTGGSNTSGDTILFVLTNKNGQIITWAATASFQNLSRGSYIAYAVSYMITEGIQQLSIGNNIQSVTSNCISFSAPYAFNVCPSTSACDYYLGDNINLDTAGANLPNATLQYILANSNGQIVQISTTPIFTNLQTTDRFFAYALAYNDGNVVNGLSVGNDINSITFSGNCYDWSAPFIFQVCLPLITDCDYYIGDNVVMDTTNGVYTNETIQYILADTNGLIVQISNTPVFNNMQNAGVFFAYALAYENGVTISNLTIGNNRSAVLLSGGCFDWSEAYIFQVCYIENPTVAITKTAVDTIQAGNTIFYTFTITNNAGVILNNVQFTDNLNNGFEFMSNPINANNGLQITGSSIYQTNTNLILNNVPIGTSIFQLYVLVPINTTTTLFCNQASLDGLSASNPNLSNTAQSNQFCTTIWKPEDCTDGIDNDLDGLIDCNDSDCGLPSARQIIYVSN